MAYQRSGQEAEARQWWDKAVQWLDQAVAKSAEPTLKSIAGLQPYDWLACHVLRREAEALFSAEKK